MKAPSSTKASAETDNTPLPRYASYLLRLRWARRDGEPICQAMLIDVCSKDRRCFSDLDGLFAYLHEQGPQVEAEPAQVHGGVET